MEGILGDVVLPPGRYNQFRLEVVEAIITIQGEDVNTTVPSSKLRFTGGFDLVAGETTVITMDFDAAKSVVIRGRMNPLLKPVVKLLVRKGGEEMTDAEQVDEIVEEPEATATPVPTPTPVPTATPAPTATSLPAVTVNSDIMAFSLENRTISVGAIVVWTNRGDAPHTSTSWQSPNPSGTWDTVILTAGQAGAAVTFDTPGTFAYFCRIHPTSMQATVLVTG